MGMHINTRQDICLLEYFYVGFTACLMLQIAATSATKYCFDSFIEEIPPVSAI